MQSNEFTVELPLYCDPAFQPNATDAKYRSDVGGLAVYHDRDPGVISHGLWLNPNRHKNGWLLIQIKELQARQSKNVTKLYRDV